MGMQLFFFVSEAPSEKQCEISVTPLRVETRPCPLFWMLRKRKNEEFKSCGRVGKKCTVLSARSARMVNSDGGEASRFARSREVGRAPTRSLGENRWQPPKAEAKLFCSRARTSSGHFQPELNLYLRP